MIKKLNLNKELTVAIDEEIKELESTIARYEKQLARKKQELTGQTPLLTDSTVSDLIKDGIREIVEELLEDINKRKILKALFLFGNNGTGKSNFLSAISILPYTLEFFRLIKASNSLTEIC